MKFADVCATCPLKKQGTLVRKGRYWDKKLIVVGSSPVHEDLFTRTPFQTQGGKLLRYMLDKAGFDSVKDVYYTYATMCGSTARTSEADKIAAQQTCAKHLAKLLVATKTYATAQQTCAKHLSKLLVTAKSHIPVLVLGSAACKVLGVEEGQWSLETFGFHDAIGAPHPARAFTDEGEYVVSVLEEILTKVANYPHMAAESRPTSTVIRDPKDLPNYNQWDGPICVDIETTGLTWWDPDSRMFLIGVSHYRDNHVNGFSENFILTEEVFRSHEGLTWLHGLWQEHAKDIGGHNFGFDILWLHNELGIPIDYGWDSMLMAYNYNPYFYRSLKDLVGFFFDVPDWSKDVHEHLSKLPKAQRTYDKVPEPDIFKYLCYDIHFNLKLYSKLEDLLKSQGRFDRPYYKFDLPLNRLLTKMEYHGFPIDLHRVREEAEAFALDIETHRKTITALSGGAIRNPGSPQQVAKYLYDDLGLVHKAGKTPPRSTKKGALDTLDHEIVDAILKYRRVSKLRSSYLVNLFDQVEPFANDRYGIAHPHNKQDGTISSRISVVGPAVQTIPKKNPMMDGDEDYGKRIKDCYTALPGYKLLAVDGSQWELRIAAAWSKDPWILDAYSRGIDVHDTACDMMYGAGMWDNSMRTKEKNIMFGLIYGGSLEGIITSAAITKGDPAKVYNFFSETLRGLMDWREEMFEEARTTGQIISPYFQRVFRFPFVHDGNIHDIRKYAVNYPIQGTASNITLEAARRAAPRLSKLGARILTTVHDSIIAMVPETLVNEAASIVGQEMCATGTDVFNYIPWVVDVEVGDTWGSLATLEWKGD